MDKCLELWRCVREDKVARALGCATGAAAWFALTLTSVAVFVTVPLLATALELRRRKLVSTGALDADELEDLY
jgi:hypothetical protein